MRFNKDVGFIKLYNGVIPQLFEVLTTSEMNVFLKLIEYIGYDCLLRDHKTTLCMRDIVNIVGIEYSSLRKIMPQLERKGIIKSIPNTNGTKKQNKYLVNPYLVFRGKDISKDILDLFRDTKWATHIRNAERHFDAT